MTKYLLIETNDQYAAQRMQYYVDMINDEFDTAIWNQSSEPYIEPGSNIGHMVIIGKKKT